MARLLTIASAILASASVALAIGVCPTTLDNTGETYFTEYIGENETTAYYAISLVDPIDQSAGNDNNNGCTTNPAYVTRYTDDDQDGCSFDAVTKLGTPTPIATGCYYEFTASNGDTLAFNMSCYDSYLSYDDAVYITETAGKKRYEFSGYGQDMCQPTSSTTQTDGPTQTWTDGPTQTYTDNTQTYTDGPTQTYTDNTQTYTDGPTQTYTDGPTAPATTTALLNYTNATFILQEYYASNLVYYIRDFLNLSTYDNTQGTITSVCNDSVGYYDNTTCVATFSNYSQSVICIEGANRGYISHVYQAYSGSGTTTMAPMPTTPQGMHSDTSSAMGILIGAMAGLVIFLALLSILYILLGRRRPTQSGDYEHLSEMNRANSNLKRV